MFSATMAHEEMCWLQNCLLLCSRCQRTHWALHKLYCNPGACLPYLYDLLAPIPDEVRADEYYELESRAKLVPNPFLREVNSRALVSKITCKPYVLLRNGTLDPKVCANCLLQQLSMKKCGGCRTVYYCCIPCQRAHWALHRLSCNPDVCLPLGTIGIFYEVRPHVDPNLQEARASTPAGNLRSLSGATLDESQAEVQATSPWNPTWDKYPCRSLVQRSTSR